MNKDKEKKNSNIRTIILSVIVSIVLWVVIGVVQDPDVHGTVTNIPIEYTNTDELAENGLVVVRGMSRTDITAQISGKRRDLMDASKNVKLVVDVNGITEAGDYTLEGTVTTTSSRITVERGRSASVAVRVEELVTKELPVKVKQLGSSKNNLIKSEPSIESVSVSGAQSEVESIEQVNAELDISGITEDCEKNAMLMPVSENGIPLQREATVSMSASRVSVKNTVYVKKTLPVKLRLTDKLSKEYWLDEKSSTVSASSVEVGLLPDSTADCVYLNISSAQTEEGDFKLTEAEGMYIPEESIEVHAKIALAKKEQRHVDIQISAKNVADGLTVAMPEKISGVLVYATGEVFSSGEVTGTVNLKDKTAGTYRIKVELDDERASTAEDIYADVTIS